MSPLNPASPLHPSHIVHWANAAPLTTAELVTLVILGAMLFSFAGLCVYLSLKNRHR